MSIFLHAPHVEDCEADLLVGLGFSKNFFVGLDGSMTKVSDKVNLPEELTNQVGLVVYSLS